MGNKYYTQFMGSLEKKPVVLSCNFVVTPTDASGVTGLAGPGIAAVYMHTSTTPVTGSPNPAAGIIMVKFQDNYPKYLGGCSQIRSPASGTNIIVTSAGALLVVGNVYQISVLGTTTAANWVTMGLPIGIPAAVGVTFVAIATGAGAGSGQVQVLNQSAVDSIELMGAPNSMLTSYGAAVLGGTSPAGNYLLFQCLTDTAASFTGNTQTSTAIASVSSYAGLRVGQLITGTGIALGTTITVLTPGSSTLTLSAAATASASGVSLVASPAYARSAPVTGSVIYMQFAFSNSVIAVQGQ